jgi:ATP-independent RNA helicase DbpA
LQPALLENLVSLTYLTMTPIQAQSLPAILEGKDIIAQAKTGSGKTAAFGLGLLEKLEVKRFRVQSLVLCPTRELADQVARELRKLGRSIHNIKILTLCGGTPFGPQIGSLEHGAHIVVGTPGRIEEHLRKGSLKLDNLNMLVLDEADRMLDMGFREDVMKIADFCGPGKQVLMLSATLKHKGLGGIAKALLQDPEKIAVGQVRQPHSSIFHQLVLADSQQHKDKLLLALLQQGNFRRALVFGNKRTTAVRMASLLQHHKLRCGCLHGEMSTEERKHVMHQFSDGKVTVVCASDVAARGLDVKDIDLVVNYDIPHSGDDYLHRTGRTGRAGAQGLAVSLVCAAEWNLMIGITLPQPEFRAPRPSRPEGAV